MTTCTLSTRFQMFAVGILLIAFCSMSLRAGDRWPEWRGPGSDGVSDAEDVPVEWSESSNIAWKTQIPGLGWSTPVIADGKIWVSTGVDKRASEEEIARRRKLTTNSQPLIFSEFVSLRLLCVDLETGKIERDIEMMTEDDPQFIHLQNSYATPSPIIDGNRIYCHYGPYGVACLEIDSGKVLWTQRTLRVKHENGPGSSPVLWKDLIFIHCDGIDKQYIVALDKDTGEIAWKSQRSGQLRDNPQLRKSYATSLVVEVNGKPQLVSPAADWVYGYDPATGKELWKLAYGELGFSNAPRPVAGHGLIYICTGYLQSRVLAIEPGDGQKPAKIAWTCKKQAPAVSSPVLVDDRLYFASDKGILSCLNAKTGETVFTGRIGKKYWASPIYADGRLYFLDSSGKTTVVAASDKFQKLAENQLDGTIFSSPAAIDGSLILRTDKALYRIR